MSTFTDKIIQDKRLAIAENEEKIVEYDDLGRKKRLALLDLLLSSNENSQLSDHDIREEVDTFMFAVSLLLFVSNYLNF